MLLMFRAWQCLCQHIGSLLGGGTELQIDDFFLHFFSNPVVMQLYMLGPIVVDWILGDLNGSCIVTHNCRWLLLGKS